MRYRGDPYWLERVKYATDCARCGRRIERGERAYYYPKPRALYCERGCGQAAAADFEAAAFDEAMMGG